MKAYLDQYRAEFVDALQSISADDVAAIGACLLDAYRRDATVFLAGNGGSAALASHFGCDLEKTSAGKNPRAQLHRFRTQSLVDNIATLTAWANDEGYEHIFSEPIRAYGHERDVLLVISASGNSPNIVRALKDAKASKLQTIGWLGFDGGQAKALCDHVLHVPSPDYGVVEGAHAVFAHLMTRWLTQEIGVLRDASDATEIRKVS